MKTLKFFLVAVTMALLFNACGDDECDVTYENEVKPIIERSCAYSGCHSGADAGMWVTEGSEDYTNYAGILANLQAGSFRARTIDSLDMPPAAYVPEGRPVSLTQAELDILICWLDNGYPER